MARFRELRRRRWREADASEELIADDALGISPNAFEPLLLFKSCARSGSGNHRPREAVQAVLVVGGGDDFGLDQILISLPFS